MNTPHIKELVAALKIHHKSVPDDPFYSCPKSATWEPGRSSDADLPRRCECGADQHNRQVDDILKLMDTP